MGVKSVVIGPARDADVSALVGLLDLLFTLEPDFSPDAAAQRAGLALILNRPETGRIFVARSGDDILGMVSLLNSVSTALGGPVGWLEDLIVAPAHRGLGIGSLLVGHALQVAREQGMLRVTLLTGADNLSAQRFYRRHGFRDSGMLPFRRLLAE